MGECIYHPDPFFNCDGTPQIGANYEGGVLFYLDETGTKGLVASVNDLDSTYQFGCFLENIDGADGKFIGNGYKNTIDILNQ